MPKRILSHPCDPEVSLGHFALKKCCLPKISLIGKVFGFFQLHLALVSGICQCCPICILQVGSYLFPSPPLLLDFLLPKCARSHVTAVCVNQRPSGNGGRIWNNPAVLPNCILDFPVLQAPSWSLTQIPATQPWYVLYFILFFVFLNLTYSCLLGQSSLVFSLSWYLIHVLRASLSFPKYFVTLFS